MEDPMRRGIALSGLACALPWVLVHCAEDAPPVEKHAVPAPAERKVAAAPVHTQETQTAADALEKECDSGDPASCTALSQLYSTGAGVVKDEYRAMSLRRRAEALKEMLEGTPTPPPDLEVEAAREGLRISEDIPGYYDWSRRVHLHNAEAEGCMPGSYSGQYYARIRRDGSIAAIHVRPRSEVARCIEQALMGTRVPPPPGSGDVWVQSSYSVAKGP
jgi:hypothetical protein